MNNAVFCDYDNYIYTMGKEYITKITKIQEELKEKYILKATVFEKLEEVILLEDAKGAQWNKFLNKQCSKYNFEIWKLLKNSYYVKATDEGRAEAKTEGLTPHTTAEVLRGKKR